MVSEIGSERVLSAIRSLPMFRGLGPAEQRQLAAVAALRDYARGDFLWRTGDASEHLTLVVSGRVKIVRHTDAGDVILEIFGEGEPVGAIAVYNYLPYPASAVCLEPATILSIPRRDFFELIDRHPDFARALIRELTQLVVALTRKLEEMRGQRVETRIAQLFLTLAGRMGEPVRSAAGAAGGDDGVEIPIQLSRQEVADLVGTTVESSIRVLSRWGREGLLLTGEGRFVIPSLARLRAAAGKEE